MVGLPKPVTSGLRLEKATLLRIMGKRSSSDTCKGPEVGTSLLRSRARRKDGAAGCGEALLDLADVTDPGVGILF